MLAQGMTKFGETTRVFRRELHARRAISKAFGDIGHALFAQLIRGDAGIGLEALARVRFRPGTAAGDTERYRPVRMAKSEMQSCEGAHGQAADMGLPDAEMVEYGQDVVRRMVL